MKTENIKLWDWVVWNQGLKPKIKWKPVKIIKYFPSKHLSWWRRLENVFRLHLQKTSWSRRIYSPYSYVFRRRLQDVLIKINIFVLVIRLQDVFKASSRRLTKTFSRSLQNVFRTSCKNVFKTSSRRLQDVLQRCLQDLFKMYHWVNLMSLRRFQNVSKT